MIRWDIGRPSHARLIASCMRDRDVAEIRACVGRDPEDAILHSLSASFYSRICFVGMVPLGIYGLSSLCVMSQTCQVWIFGTRHIDNHRLSFMKASRIAVRALAFHALRVTNYIDSEDAPAHKWLRALGGQLILSDIERGGRRFDQFLLEAKACRQG